MWDAVREGFVPLEAVWCDSGCGAGIAGRESPLAMAVGAAGVPGRSANGVSLLFAQGVFMNNLNDPPNWNILPHHREPRDEGSRWNYALLVPMLGLAAFRK